MRRRLVVIVASVVALVVVAAGVTIGWVLVRSAAASGPECTVPRPAGAPGPPGAAGPGSGVPGGGTDAAASGSAAGSGPAGSWSGSAGSGSAAGSGSGSGSGSAAPSGPLGLDAVQLQHASTIDAVGLARGLPQRARVIALATAWQESSLRNVDHGDRDSVGLFQQRPSQGWGTVAQIMDPVYASNKFYDALLDVHGWQQMSLADAAQAVQYSGYPSAYAKWEPDALALAVQLGGTVELSLSCRSGATASTATAPTRPALTGASGADPALADLLAAGEAELSGLRVRSVDPDGRGATVTVSLPGASGADSGRALAAWVVAHATTSGVSAVSVLGRTWSDHAWAPAGSPLPAGAVHVTVSR